MFHYFFRKSHVKHLVIFVVFFVFACSSGGKTSSKTWTIGPEGGEIETEELLLSFPEGAFSDETDVTVTSSNGNIWEFSAISKLYSLGPAGQTFAKPVQMTFKLTDQTPSALFWRPDEYSSFQKHHFIIEDGFIKTNIMHFSDYVAGEQGEFDCDIWDHINGEWLNCPNAWGDEYVAVAFQEWGDFAEQPPTEIAFRNRDPLNGHIQLLEVEVTEIPGKNYNVASLDQGEQNLGIQSPDTTWAWLWEYSDGIDDTKLPQEWQNHDRHPSPNDFSIWPEDVTSSMNYRVCFRYGKLDLNGWTESDTLCNDYFGRATDSENTDILCSDGEDNDGDQLVDCDDPDCEGIASCPSSRPSVKDVMTSAAGSYDVDCSLVIGPEFAGLKNGPYRFTISPSTMTIEFDGNKVTVPADLNDSAYDCNGCGARFDQPDKPVIVLQQNGFLYRSTIYKKTGIAEFRIMEIQNGMAVGVEQAICDNW